MGWLVGYLGLDGFWTLDLGGRRGSRGVSGGIISAFPFSFFHLSFSIFSFLFPVSRLGTSLLRLHDGSISVLCALCSALCSLLYALTHVLVRGEKASLIWGPNRRGEKQS